jgi:lipoyl(octanoyl) transferase
MNIEIKKSIKPINYFDAINLLEKRLEDLYAHINKELIWTLEHDEIFTAGTSYKENEILDNSIDLIKTNRGGKITCHAPGQLICYFVIDLRKKKDIRKFISCIEKTIIETLKYYKIETFSDKDNIGIWHKKNNSVNKVAAIGVRVKKWIAYHGFALNINNNLDQYKKIIPCGVKDKGVTNLVGIIDKDYSNLGDVLIEKIYFKPENLSLLVFSNFLK